MRISSTKILMVAAVILATGAGALVGVAASRPQAPAPKRPEGSWLAQELRLTPEQQDQMRTIWAHATNTGEDFAERRSALEKERDDALQALLSPTQREEYQQIRDQYTQKVGEVRKDREKVMAAAVEQTKQILSAEQRAKYEELLKRRGARRRGHNRPDSQDSSLRGRPAESQPADAVLSTRPDVNSAR